MSPPLPPLPPTLNFKNDYIDDIDFFPNRFNFCRLLLYLQQSLLLLFSHFVLNQKKIKVHFLQTKKKYRQISKKRYISMYFVCFYLSQFPLKTAECSLSSDQSASPYNLLRPPPPFRKIIPLQKFTSSEYSRPILIVLKVIIQGCNALSFISLSFINVGKESNIEDRK